MVHSSPNNNQSRVHQSQACFLHITHLGILKVHDQNYTIKEIQYFCLINRQPWTAIIIFFFFSKQPRQITGSGSELNWIYSASCTSEILCQDVINLHSHDLKSCNAAFVTKHIMGGVLGPTLGSWWKAACGDRGFLRGCAPQKWKKNVMFKVN